MIYKNALGNPDPKATISVFGSNYGKTGTGYFCLTAANRTVPNKRWDYLSKDVSHIVADMESDGWICTVRKDGYGAPVIDCIHTETAKALEDNKIVLSGKFEEGYIRFGHLPKSGQSTNQATGEIEPGVSVYRAKFYRDGYEVETPHYSQGTYISVSARLPVYRVWGREVGNGYDGEPCLKVIKTKLIVK